MRYKKIGVFFFLFALLCLSQGQDKNNEDARVLLERISKSMNSAYSLKLIFSLKLETYNGKLKIQHQKKGTLWFKGGKYKLLFEQQEIYCDGSTVWTYDKSTNEVQITKVDEQATISPQKLLTDFYTKDFIYKLNPKVKRNNKIFQEIELTPIDKSKPFFKVYILIEDTLNGNIAQIKIFEKNGSRYTYDIHRIMRDKKVKDNFFIFNQKNQKIEIIDLR